MTPIFNPSPYITLFGGGSYISHNGGPIPPPYPPIWGGPLPYPPSPWGVFRSFRGVDTLNEICGYFLRGVCVAEISEKIFGKFEYLLG